MTLLSKELRFVHPDLKDVPLEQLTAPGDSALAHCFALYRQRLEASTLLLGAFNSNI
ncbi:MAG: hypothetical protein ACLPKE_13070 [Streptosporangiaceae bacterium]